RPGGEQMRTSRTTPPRPSRSDPCTHPAGSVGENPRRSRSARTRPPRAPAMTPRDAPRSGPPARRGRQRAAFAQSCSAADQLLECGLVANRIEVRVLLRHVPAALPHLDRPPKVPDGLVGLTREALAAQIG